MADIPCVGAVVFDDTNRLLLVKRANPPAQGMWSLPGGRLEVGETAEQGVVREVREETGLLIEVEREVGTVHRTAPGGGTYVIRDFLCTGSGEPVAGDDACRSPVRDGESTARDAHQRRPGRSSRGLESASRRSTVTRCC